MYIIYVKNSGDKEYLKKEGDEWKGYLDPRKATCFKDKKVAKKTTEQISTWCPKLGYFALHIGVYEDHVDEWINKIKNPVSSYKKHHKAIVPYDPKIHTNEDILRTVCHIKRYEGNLKITSTWPRLRTPYEFSNGTWEFGYFQIFEIYKNGLIPYIRLEEGIDAKKFSERIIRICSILEPHLFALIEGFEGEFRNFYINHNLRFGEIPCSDVLLQFETPSKCRIISRESLEGMSFNDPRRIQYSVIFEGTAEECSEKIIEGIRYSI